MNLLRTLTRTAVLVLVVSATLSSTLHALSVPPAPALDRPVIDQTSTLSDQQITEIANVINQGRTEKSYQLAVLMISTLEDENLEEYSLNVARTWGVGEKSIDNGVLLLIAKDDRKLRIEVGNGLEGDLTDAESSRIIRNTITPEFKNNDFYGGIKYGVQSIQAQVEGTASSNADSNSDAKSGSAGFDIWAIINAVVFFGLTGLSWLASIFGRSKSWWAGGLAGGGAGGLLVLVSSLALWSLILLPVLIVIGLLFDWFVSRNYKSHRADGTSPAWWAGGGSGSSSSGGSFGGGGFSGGGSNGSW